MKTFIIILVVLIVAFLLFYFIYWKKRQSATMSTTTPTGAVNKTETTTTTTSGAGAATTVSGGTSSPTDLITYKVGTKFVDNGGRLGCPIIAPNGTIVNYGNSELLLAEINRLKSLGYLIEYFDNSTTVLAGTGKG